MDEQRFAPGALAASLLIVGCGLAGAMGVALAAIAAHKVDSPALVTAANMLMVHAAAGTGIAAFLMKGERSFIPAGALMLAAVALFAGDVTVHALTGNHVFPYAAPIGGSLTICSWVLLALIALRQCWRNR